MQKCSILEEFYKNHPEKFQGMILNSNFLEFEKHLKDCPTCTLFVKAIARTENVLLKFNKDYEKLDIDVKSKMAKINEEYYGKQKSLSYEIKSISTFSSFIDFIGLSKFKFQYATAITLIVFFALIGFFVYNDNGQKQFSISELEKVPKTENVKQIESVSKIVNVKNDSIAFLEKLTGGMRVKNYLESKEINEKNAERYAIFSEDSITALANSNCKIAFIHGTYDMEQNACISVKTEEITIDKGLIAFNFKKSPKLSKKPFIVRSQKIEVKVIGTKFTFNVDNLKNTISMSEGRVEIKSLVAELTYCGYLSKNQTFEITDKMIKITDANLNSEKILTAKELNKELSNKIEMKCEIKNAIKTEEIAIVQDGKEIMQSSEVEVETSEIFSATSKNPDISETDNSSSAKISFPSESNWLNSIKNNNANYYNNLIKMKPEQRTQIYLKNKKAFESMIKIKEKNKASSGDNFTE